MAITQGIQGQWTFDGGYRNTPHSTQAGISFHRYGPAEDNSPNNLDVVNSSGMMIIDDTRTHGSDLVYLYFSEKNYNPGNAKLYLSWSTGSAISTTVAVIAATSTIWRFARGSNLETIPTDSVIYVTLADPGQTIDPYMSPAELADMYGDEYLNTYPNTPSYIPRPIANVYTVGKRWTNNAAVIRFWWLTQRRGVPLSKIDGEHLQEAIEVCDERLALSSHAEYRSEYPASVKRYAINGVYTSEQSASSTEKQFDLCWQGSVVEFDGKLHFKPGKDRPVKLKITEDDIIDFPKVYPATPRDKKFNQASVILKQSSRNNYGEQRFIVIDENRQEKERERLPLELPTLSYMNEPVQAINIIYQNLKKSGSTFGFVITCKPRKDFSIAKLMPGDKIELELSEYGVGQVTPGGGSQDIRYFEVVSNRMAEDVNIVLQLRYWPDGLYDDRFNFPLATKRNLPIPSVIEAPENLTIFWNFFVSQASVLSWQIRVFWEPSPYKTNVVLNSDNNESQDITVDGSSATFLVNETGNYEIRANHIDRYRSASQESTFNFAIGFDDITVPTPVVIDQRVVGGALHISLQGVTNREIAGIEVRYRRTFLLDTVELPTISENDWTNSLLMDVVPTIPTEENSDPILANMLFPSSGKYRLFIRFKNSVGNLSPITEIGFYSIDLPISANTTFHMHPLWEGTLNNMILWPHDDNHYLLPDPSDRDAATYDDWNSLNGWPFGEVAGYNENFDDAVEQTSYTTNVINLDNLVKAEITVAPTLRSPTGALNTDYTVDLQLTYSAQENLVGAVSVAMNSNVGNVLTSVRSFQIRAHLKQSKSVALSGFSINIREY